MSQIIEAIFQNGTFRPLGEVDPAFYEGEEVVINVESRQKGVNPIMKLAENFYEGLSEKDIDDIERIALNRSNFFGERDL